MEKRWWKESVIYQVYPRSFNDSNGDGIGDLKGIIEKIDYLKWLGVDVIWLSPVYQSPNFDNGYDISDYYTVMDEFGTMEDLMLLIDKLHGQNMKLVMDLVVNHTSDEHEWFVKSRLSKENPYRTYYIWEKGSDGKPPNNWGSWFGGPVWEYDKETGEYYLHLFSKKQPDLNWDNPAVRDEIYKMMSWWLDKGIDGFRMDVINLISKDRRLPAGKKEQGGSYGDGSPFYVNGPRVHQYLQEMNRRVLSRYDIMTVGETPGVTPEEGIKYVDRDRQELNMIFHFDIVGLDRGLTKWEKKEWSLTDLKKIIGRWWSVLKKRGWNSNYLNNHDQPRMVSRFGDDTHYWKESAKLLATMVHTLPGTPYIYQGEEIGMTNVSFNSIDDYRDIETLNWYEEMVKEDMPLKRIMIAIHRVSRDNARTPVQWDDSGNAGFTSGVPWIRINDNYKKINVKDELEDNDSILHYYRRLISLRKSKENRALIYGDYTLLMEDSEEIFAYIRELKEDRMLVILNFSSREAVFKSFVSCKEKELLIDNYADITVESNVDSNINTNIYTDINSDINTGINTDTSSHKDSDTGSGANTEITLRPYEARVYRLK